ncbi:AF4/FMR2 family member 4 [Drosophila busckii]|uniref:AF4/FMR2 family member 4 n=1 Tax=Drosophila busckii TaxID=30019 RepID=UPI0014328B94|nr:AF4/FMR2 family member 4 [Drosophila busckii]
MRIKMPAVRIAQDSDSTENDAVAAQDILTCGACQKAFALSDIVRFIQHKVVQCNKENYGQCTTQAPSMDRDADEGRPLSLVNRRPSISAPITCRKSAPAAAGPAARPTTQTQAAAAVANSAASGSRIHTPPPSPADLLADGASSTPKRLVDENDNTTPKADSEVLTSDSTTPLERHSPRIECELDDDKPKVKQEPYTDDEPMPQRQQHQQQQQQREEEEEQMPLARVGDGSGVGVDEPLAKRPKMELVDAEANTVHTEPSNYTCSTCKTRYSSAWRLIQHVQHSHGVKIYVESSGLTVATPAAINAAAVAASSSSHNNSSSNNSNSNSSNLSSPQRSLSPQVGVPLPLQALMAQAKRSSSNQTTTAATVNTSNCSSNSNNNNSSSNASSPSQQQQQQQQRAQQQQQQLQPQQQQQQLRHHALLAPPEALHANPFQLLRMPLPPALAPGNVVPNVSPLFARHTPADHFRMEQLVSEQFRQHGFNLAAAAAAAAQAQFSQQQQQQHSPTVGVAVNVPSVAEARSPNSSSSSSSQRLTPAAAAAATQQQPQQQPTPAAAALSPAAALEPQQMDFYSQRLRQLAGTTSPGAGNIVNSSSPSPRQKQSPRFASPTHSSSSQHSQQPAQQQQQQQPIAAAALTRPHSLTPPERENGQQLTPRAASTPPSKAPATAAAAAAATVCTLQEEAAQLSCSYCDKKFRYEHNLIIHQRTHTGEKPYKCTACDFECSHIQKLMKHMRVHRSPAQEQDLGSNADSLETNEDNGDDSEVEEDEELEAEGEGEEDEEDEDDCEDVDYEAEDLSVNNRIDGKSQSPKTQGSSSGATSLVGELMDKFGLSNIAQYSEAYKQALQESGRKEAAAVAAAAAAAAHVDNNNRAANGLPVAALRLRDEFAKNCNMFQAQAAAHAAQQQQQQQQEVPGAGAAGQVPLFNPFPNPFELSKRIKMDGGDWWSMSSALHRNEALFENLKLKPLGLGGANSLLQGPLLKKESRQRNDTCEFCGKVFKNCSNLTVHRRSHTGEKPYKCELCSYACAQSSKLTRHMKTHGRTGKDVYRCRFCDMPFSVPSTLEKHMRKCVVNQGKAAAAAANAANAVAAAQAAAAAQQQLQQAAAQQQQQQQTSPSCALGVGVGYPPQFVGGHNLSLAGSVSGDNDSNASSSLPAHSITLKEEA